MYSVWAGRYPTPTKKEDYVGSIKPENFHTFSPADEHLCDALFARLSEALQAELEKQITKRN